jgi:hypothetical protein
VTDQPIDDESPREHRMTVARLRPSLEGTQVMFYESARIYLLPAANLHHDEIAKRLTAARESGRVVHVRVTEPHGTVIEDVQ